MSSSAVERSKVSLIYEMIPLSSSKNEKSSSSWSFHFNIKWTMTSPTRYIEPVHACKIILYIVVIRKYTMPCIDDENKHNKLQS